VQSPADQQSQPVVSRLLPSLWGFAFLSYLLRTNIAVAQQYMAREINLNEIQIGYLFTAFLIGYTIFQVPTGLWGDRFGPRIVLTASALVCAMMTLLTGFIPGLILKGTLVSLTSLILFRFILGLGQAATYPVAMTAVSDWFPTERHTSLNSLIFTGSTLGAAFAPPLVANIMSLFGWRATFYLTGVLPIFLALYWWHQTKHQHHKAAERNLGLSNCWSLLKNQSVLYLCVSYFLYCYTISIFVYWLFKYLVDVRHLSTVKSGWTASLPWIAATVIVPVLGSVSDRLALKTGPLRGRRRVAACCLMASALLVVVAAETTTIVIAVAAIAASVALLFSTEACYWSTSIEVAGGDSGTAGGLMNLAGNFGGVVSTMLVAVLVHQFGWLQALLSGSFCAILATIFWFLVRSHDDSQNVVDTL
jgi:MFS transporter, ACS family, glucarate transporter